MSVFKRGPVFHYAFMLNGTRYRGSTKEATVTKARAFESMLMARIVESGGNQLLKKAPLLSEAAVKFLAETDAQAKAANLDEDTRRHYHNGWRALKELPVAGMRIDQITTGIAASLKFAGGPWNARACQQVLGRILNWSAEKGYMRTAPKIKRAKAKGRADRIPPEMEAELLRHMERDVADMFVIMLSCGLRCEEAMRMRWADVRWDKGEYFNPFGKTDASRRFVPMADRMQQVLRSRENNSSEWVFPSRDIEPADVDLAEEMLAAGASINAVAKATRLSWPMAKRIKLGKLATISDTHRVTVALQWESAREAAGIDPKIVLYTARHEFAKRFLEAGGNVYRLMKIMGHTSITTTMKYLHEDLGDAREVINRTNNKAGLRIVKSA